MRGSNIEIPKTPLQDRRQTSEEYRSMLEKEEELKAKLADLINRQEAEVMIETANGKALTLKVNDKNGKLIYFEDMDAIEQAFSRIERPN